MTEPPDPTQAAAPHAPAESEPWPGWALVQFDWGTRDPGPRRRGVVLRSVAQAAARAVRLARAVICRVTGALCARSVPNER